MEGSWDPTLHNSLKPCTPSKIGFISACMWLAFKIASTDKLPIKHGHGLLWCATSDIQGYDVGLLGSHVRKGLARLLLAERVQVTTRAILHHQARKLACVKMGIQCRQKRMVQGRKNLLLYLCPWQLLPCRKCSLVHHLAQRHHTVIPNPYKLLGRSAPMMDQYMYVNARY